jgi:hypothetical protein
MISQQKTFFKYAEVESNAMGVFLLGTAFSVVIFSVATLFLAVIAVLIMVSISSLSYCSTIIFAVDTVAAIYCHFVEAVRASKELS